MAEGLDGAAAAFHTEINPQARPRDDGGRFSSSAARPETMFEERPVEGDPLTGDTRDGGEDARLATRERRIADGWLDERADGETQSRSRNAPAQTERESGERRVQPDAAQRHDAPADERHPRTEAQPERIGEQEPADQDAQGPDGKPKASGDEGDPEGTSEPDAEGGKWEVSLDGKPVEKLEVLVDGQPHTVTLDEVVRGYVDGETYQKRVAQVGEAVQVIQSQWAQASQLRDNYIQQLQHHEEEYAALLPKEPNWDDFYNRDPLQARQTQKNYQAAVNTLYAIRQRRMQEMQARDQEAAARTAEYARNGFEQFKRNARFADNVQLNNELGAMRRIGLEYGFEEHELSTVYDPRMLAVLHDASKYRRMTANKPRPVMPDKGRTLAPGSARPIGSAARRGIDDLQSKLAKTGKLDDAAALFQRLIK
jgi:hypothetical protein